MATHRAIPGANLPQSGTSGRKSHAGGEVGEGAPYLSGSTGLGNDRPGTGGIGSGAGAYAGSAERSYPRPAGVMDQMKQQATTRVNEQKDRAVQGLGSVASAIRQASEHLRSENQTLAAYADRAVDQIQLFTDRMRDKEPEEMIRDVEQFARRNPTAFVGGAFLLGVGLARFLKSSGTATATRGVMHEDTDFGRSGLGASTSVSGTSGYTAADGLARPDDLSRPSGGLTTDPAPGITS